MIANQKKLLEKGIIDALENSIDWEGVVAKIAEWGEESLVTTDERAWDKVIWDDKVCKL